MNTSARFVVALLPGVSWFCHAEASPNLALDGHIVRVDLDDDGKRERVALRALKIQRRQPIFFLLSVNGKKSREQWPGNDPLHDWFVDSLQRGSRRRYLFVSDQSPIEGVPVETMIYRWQRGHLRRVTPWPMSIRRIEHDGSVIEGDGAQWISILYRWKLNRHGALERVRRKMYPIYSSGMNPDAGQKKISIQLGGFARFYRNPSWKAVTATFPAGTSVVFTGINEHNWLRARIRNQMFWIHFNSVDQSFSAFPFPRAS